jgi:hypothetical protein
VEEVIVKTQEEITEKAHTTALSTQNRATGNQWYESRPFHVVFSGIPRQYIR